MTTEIESWRKAWRVGLAPGLSTNGLTALAKAIRSDDKRLVQGATTTPSPLQCVQDWPCEAACALGFCGWQGDGLATVGEVEEHFAKCCFDADQRLGEPAACRWFLNAYDDWLRDEMRRELLAEVESELTRRLTLSGTDVPPMADDTPTPFEVVVPTVGLIEAAKRVRRVLGGESLTQVYGPDSGLAVLYYAVDRHDLLTESVQRLVESQTEPTTE